MSSYVSLESVTATPERLRALRQAAYDEFIVPAHARKPDPDEPLTRDELYPERRSQEIHEWRDNVGRELAERLYLGRREAMTAMAEDWAEDAETERRGGQLALFYRSDARPGDHLMTIHGLHQRVAQLLDFIHTWIAEHGTAPTYDEMAAAQNVGRATIDGRLAILEARGWLTRSGKFHRRSPTVVITKAWPPASTTATVRDLTGSTRT